jgi:hypothetical protein
LGNRLGKPVTAELVIVRNRCKGGGVEFWLTHNRVMLPAGKTAFRMVVIDSLPL